MPSNALLPPLALTRSARPGRSPKLAASRTQDTNNRAKKILCRFMNASSGPGRRRSLLRPDLVPIVRPVPASVNQKSRQAFQSRYQPDFSPEGGIKNFILGQPTSSGFNRSALWPLAHARGVPASRRARTRPSLASLTHSARPGCSPKLAAFGPVTRLDALLPRLALTALGSARPLA